MFEGCGWDNGSQNTTREVGSPAEKLVWVGGVAFKILEKGGCTIDRPSIVVHKSLLRAHEPFAERSGKVTRRVPTVYGGEMSFFSGAMDRWRGGEIWG